MNKKFFGLEEKIGVFKGIGVDKIITQHLKSDLNYRQEKIGYHPSMISRYCVWSEVYKRMMLDGKPRLYKNPESQQRVFDIGKALHKLYQEYLGKAGVLIGKWSCPSCGEVYEGKYPDHACGGCGLGDGEYNYIETRIKYRIHNDFDVYISGYADGIIEVDEERFVIDIKTVNTFFYGKITKGVPYPEYYEQLNIYMGCLGIKKGALVFVNKETGKCKEICYDFDKEKFDLSVGVCVEIESNFQECKKRAIEIYGEEFLDSIMSTEKLIGVNIIMKECIPSALKMCSTIDCKIAKGCEYSVVCNPGDGKVMNQW